MILLRWICRVWLLPAVLICAAGSADLRADEAASQVTQASDDSDMVEELRDSQVGWLIEHFSYAAIIAVLFVCGLGFPLPEEVPILTSAILSHAGVLNPWWAVTACLIGVMVGDSVMFYLGRRWGGHVFDHRLAKILLTERRQRVIAYYFHRYGARIIFVARFLPGIRSALFLTAGTNRVRYATFLVMDGAAALLSIPASFWVAFYFTDKLEKFLATRETVQFWAFGLLIAGLAIWYGVHRWWTKRTEFVGHEPVKENVSATKRRDEVNCAS